MVFNGTSVFSAWIGTAENRKPLTAAVIIKLETCYDQLFVFLSVNFPLQCIWPSPYDTLNTFLGLFFGSIVVLYSNVLLPLILLYYFQEKEYM